MKHFLIILSMLTISAHTHSAVAAEDDTPGGAWTIKDGETSGQEFEEPAPDHDWWVATASASGSLEWCVRSIGEVGNDGPEIVFYAYHNSGQTSGQPHSFRVVQRGTPSQSPEVCVGFNIFPGTYFVQLVADDPLGHNRYLIKLDFSADPVVERYALSRGVTPTGTGTISADPPPDSDGEYEDGTVVTLRAVPGPGLRFWEWLGDASGSANPIQVTMNSDKAIVALFTQDQFLGDQEGWCGMTDDPVNTATGNFLHEETDLSIITRSTPLEIVRYYNSREARDGPLGSGWSHSYNIVLTEHTDTNEVSVRWADGRTDYWDTPVSDTYTITDLGALVSYPNYPSYANAVNDLGQVVGKARGSDGFLPVLWDNGIVSQLEVTIDSESSEAIDINNLGWAAGYSPRNLTYNHAALWQDGQLIDLGRLQDDLNSSALAINDSGDIVGESDDHPVIWHDGQIIKLGRYAYGKAVDINNQGQVVISDWIDCRCVYIIEPVDSDGDGQPDTWFLDNDSDGYHDFVTPLGSDLVADAINDAGDVVGTDIEGYIWVHSSDEQAFRGGASPTGTPYDTNHPGMGNPTDINNSGQVVGSTGGSAFMWNWREDVLVDLNDVLPPDSGWQLESAHGINEAGQIVGYGTHDGNTRAFLLSPDRGSLPTVPGRYSRLRRDSAGNWIATRKNLDVYRFDSGGRLMSISDKNGNATDLTYDNQSFPMFATGVAGPAGRMLTLDYDTIGRLQNVTDFAVPPRAVQFTYAGGRLTQVTDVHGKPINYTYNADGYLVTITDQRGVTTVTNIYDGDGRVIEQRDGNGNLTTLQYDSPAGNQTKITHTATVGGSPRILETIHTHQAEHKLLLSITNPLSHVTSFGYDAANNRTTVTDRNGNVIRFAYDNRGNVISTTLPNSPTDPNDGGVTTAEFGNGRFPDLPTWKHDALGHETRWAYDYHGNVTRQVDTAGHERIWSYNSFGQRVSEQDERGNITQYIYDLDGRLTETIDAAGDHTWFAYDELWRLTATTDGRGSAAGDPNHTSSFDYDRADRLIQTAGPPVGVPPESITRYFDYDEAGNITRETNGRGYSTVHTYDNNSTLARVEQQGPGGSTVVTQHAHDELRRRTSTTDPNGYATFFEYDDAGRLVKVTDAEGNETTVAYDAQGNVTAATDGSGVTIRHEYDALNRRVQTYDAMGNHWYWLYDKLDQLTRHTNANGKLTAYSYDELGRLVRVTDAHGNSTAYLYDEVANLTEVRGSDQKIIARKYYDVVDRLIRQEDGNGNEYNYGYDPVGNQTSVTDANGSTTTLIYDGADRLISIHYPVSPWVEYGYDKNDNLTSVIDHGPTALSYDELDRLTSSTNPLGQQVQYTYDPAGNRTGITYPADTTQPPRTVVYAYDRADRLGNITDWAGRRTNYTVDGAGRITHVVFANGVQESRSYDVAGRLTSLTSTESGGGPLLSFGYTRDGEGNPIGVTKSGTLAPQPSGLLGGFTYNYDQDNRLTSTTVPATYEYDNNGNLTSRTVDGVTTSFGYDFEDRLISQTTGGSTVEHGYDGLGDRVSRGVNGMWSSYILDRGRGMSHVLCETDALGEIAAYYVHGPQIVARIGVDGSERYYHTDHVGSVAALTDATETVTDRYAYTPFGVPAGTEGSTRNPFTYVGGLGVMAEADQLYFMRARFYDPNTGRFLGKDPIEGALTDPQRLHRYVYAGNHPTISVDPNGEAFLTLSALAFGIKLASVYISVIAGGIALDKELERLNEENPSVDPPYAKVVLNVVASPKYFVSSVTQLGVLLDVPEMLRDFNNTPHIWEIDVEWLSNRAKEVAR